MRIANLNSKFFPVYNTPVKIIYSDFLVTLIGGRKARGVAPLFWIFIRRPYYNGGFVVSSTTGIKSLDSVVRHEVVHIERQKQQGRFIWLFKYIFSRKFRMYEESIARMAE